MNDSSLRDSYANAIQYHKKNNFKKAEEIYLQLLKSNPKNYVVLGNMGLLSIQLEKYDIAVNYLENLYSTDPYVISDNLIENIKKFSESVKLFTENEICLRPLCSN